jgi:hypothetical protein
LWTKEPYLEDILKNNRAIAWTFSVVLAVGTIVGVAASADGQKSAGGSAGGKQWLAAMDTDHDGTASKQEFDTYMDAQFANADVDHDGTLDV